MLQKVLGTGMGSGDIPDGSQAPGHKPCQPSVGAVVALFSRKKSCFGGAIASCELRLGSAPGCGSPRLEKPWRFALDIFQMRCFDLSFLFFFFSNLFYSLPQGNVWKTNLARFNSNLFKKVKPLKTKQGLSFRTKCFGFHFPFGMKNTNFIFFHFPLDLQTILLFSFLLLVHSQDRIVHCGQGTGEPWCCSQWDGGPRVGTSP